MKRSFFLLLMIIVCTANYAQCDKKFVLSSSKTEYLDEKWVVQRSVDEKSTIEISKSELIIIPGSEENKMSGTIKSSDCNWKVPFKEGKTIIKATLVEQSGDTKNVTITIEGKEGKLTLLAEVDDMPERKVRVAIDKFEEKG